MTFVVANTQHEAVARQLAGETVYTIVCSPLDGSFWYSTAIWRDATYAWHLKRHVKDGFFRLTDEMRSWFEELDFFTAGENAEYVEAR